MSLHFVGFQNIVYDLFNDCLCILVRRRYMQYWFSENKRSERKRLITLVAVNENISLVLEDGYVNFLS